MATAQGVTTRRKPFGNKLANYLASNPSEYDVTFLVGQEKKEIRSLRIALKAACPALDKLCKERWDTGLGRGESGIPLNDLDPAAFEIFIQLLLSDDWSLEEIEGMKLPAESILNLLKISNEFAMKELEEIFQSVFDKIIKNFENFKLNEILKLSRKNLDLFLDSDLLAINEVVIFNVACKWAEYQCAEQGLEPIGHNLRSSLGSAIFKIRFSLMTNTEFANFVCSKKILTNEEQLQILLHIAMNNQNAMHDSSFPFNTQRRKTAICVNSQVPVIAPMKPVSIAVGKKQDEILSFFKTLNFMDNPPFSFGEVERTLFRFNVSSKITLQGVGFLGPVNGDATYHVNLELRRRLPMTSERQSICSVQKIVVAKQRQIFHVSFDTPIVIEAYSTQQKNIFNGGNGYYFFRVLVKGQNTQSLQFLNGSKFKDLRSEVDGTTIYTQHWCDQGVEIKFTNC